MNDFSYQQVSKDDSFFYSSEPTQFSRSDSINKSNSYTQSQEYDQWKSNSLPTTTESMALPTTSMNNPATNPISCDLQEVIIYYQSQPELLRLILLSKVEEDKRRTEEAKLRAKELDLLLVQQQQQFNAISPQSPDASMMPAPQTNLMPNNNLLNTNQFCQTPRRPSALEILMEDTDCDRRDSALGSSFDGSSNSDELEDGTFSPNSAASCMLSMSFPHQPMMSVTAPRTYPHPLSPPYNISQCLDDTSFTSQIQLESEETDQQGRRFDSSQRPRRRREMQAISKIVETRDYPYVDGFFWKNNGNTIQKKTGNKSVYYKCSNSSKGCPVNKTVTWKDNGEFLIKYRGEHLVECGNVQRIVDM